jgi:hypothetical protein
MASKSNYTNLEALDKRIEELNRLEHDIDFGQQRRRPTPNLPAAPSSVHQNAGLAIMGLKR